MIGIYLCIGVAGFYVDDNKVWSVLQRFTAF